MIAQQKEEEEKERIRREEEERKRLEEQRKREEEERKKREGTVFRFKNCKDLASGEIKVDIFLSGDQFCIFFSRNWRYRPNSFCIGICRQFVLG